eukprot:scaffold207290_cov20-Tisochrysis_lutea.AAC.1
MHTHAGLDINCAGSGKTWTTKHLSQYLAVSLFERASQDHLKLKVKYVEVYMVRGGARSAGVCMDKFKDLIFPENARVDIFETGGSTYNFTAKEVTVESPEQLQEILDNAEHVRKTSKTHMNTESQALVVVCKLHALTACTKLGKGPLRTFIYWTALACAIRRKGAYAQTGNVLVRATIAALKTVDQWSMQQQRMLLVCSEPSPMTSILEFTVAFYSRDQPAHMQARQCVSE